MRSRAIRFKRCANQKVNVGAHVFAGCKYKSRHGNVWEPALPQKHMWIAPSAEKQSTYVRPVMLIARSRIGEMEQGAAFNLVTTNTLLLMEGVRVFIWFLFFTWRFDLTLKRHIMVHIRHLIRQWKRSIEIFNWDRPENETRKENKHIRLYIVCNHIAVSNVLCCDVIRVIIMRCLFY